MYAALKNVRNLTVVWRSLFSAILIAAFLFGPFAFVGDASAKDHQQKSSTSHESGPAQDDNTGQGHALIHCGSSSCAPSFVSASACAAAPTHALVGHPLTVGKDALLPSLYLDSDPPVPRGVISRT